MKIDNLNRLILEDRLILEEGMKSSLNTDKDALLEDVKCLNKVKQGIKDSAEGNTSDMGIDFARFIK